MNKYIMEFIGNLFLVLIIGLTSTPIAIGLGFAVLVYMGAHISGAHYNPAVSLAMLINKKLSPKELGFYIFYQLLGAVFATYTLYFLGNEDFSVVSNTSDISQFIVSEILFTFLLVFVILNVALNKNIEGNQYFGLAIGLTVAAGAFSVGDISGAVFNPAISFGASVYSFIDPEVGTNALVSSDFFIYYLITGIVGAVIASYAYKKIAE